MLVGGGAKVTEDVAGQVAAVRGFNRFWTRRIGVLAEGYLGSEFSLTQVRVLYELAHREETTASDLIRELGLDAGYLSRILRGFEGRALISRRRSSVDGRRSLLRLTERGRQAFDRLDARSREDIGAMLDELTPEERERAVGAMRGIERVLGARSEQPYLLRRHRPGDMGWVVHRHGVLYSREYGWDEQFEALVAEIVAKFIRQYDPERERCWIAERDGEAVGSVFLVRHSEVEARLRLLLVEPSARGLGVGARLVEECVAFARATGYRRISLWTNDVLHAARYIYEGAGFRLTHEEPHHSFGHDLIGQTWELNLQPPAKG